ncbi:hypothetical protein CEXT_804941 [Caerostris extrusa]|uniref:Uncharacterized protein n=1 Tax=Caerostris extrusa TaxID=172846 RepID=A0AAV4MBB1_CAEEX|nr:hypothetical protein CEXT_804941 [Caerostris extrusa]
MEQSMLIRFYYPTHSLIFFLPCLWVDQPKGILINHCKLIRPRREMSTFQSNPSGLTRSIGLQLGRKPETTYKVDLLKRLGQGISIGTKSTDNDSSFVQWEMIL